MGLNTYAKRTYAIRAAGNDSLLLNNSSKLEDHDYIKRRKSSELEDSNR